MHCLLSSSFFVKSTLKYVGHLFSTVKLLNQRYHFFLATSQLFLHNHFFLEQVLFSGMVKLRSMNKRGTTRGRRKSREENWGDERWKVSACSVEDDKLRREFEARARGLATR